MRPLIKEDGTGTPAHEVITYDPDDDGLVYVQSKGRTKTFTFDKVFPASSSQNEVSKSDTDWSILSVSVLVIQGSQLATFQGGAFTLSLIF